MEKKYLADILDYKRNIEPYQFINLYAGAGSGKNTFIEKLAKGEIANAPKMRVLLITSRRAKVDETFQTYQATDEESIGLFRQSLGGTQEIYNPFTGVNELATWRESVICTSAFFAAYLKNCYRPDDKRTHVWQAFDAIIIDEVHAMILDSTYQDAPFHIWDFINHYIGIIEENKCQMRCKHLILMTATPDSLVDYTCSTRHDLNLLETCHNIQPQKVRFIEKAQVERLLKQIITNGKRCMYFANHVSRIEREIIGRMNLPKDKIVRSYSKESERNRLQEEDPQAYADMVEVEESLKTFEIPERFNVFLTTTRYREGINLETDLDVMFIESHNATEVIQMAGRARRGVKELYIVIDAEGHPVDLEEDHFERFIQKYLFDCGKTANGISLINDMLNEVSTSELVEFIDFIEAKFAYIRYSYFNGCFIDYTPKKSAVKYIEAQRQQWDIAKATNRLPELVQAWFSDSKIMDYEPEKERKYRESWHVCNELGIEPNKPCDKATYNTLKARLSEIWGDKQMAKLLKRFSRFEVKRQGKSKDKYVFTLKSEDPE